jgi:hypothetical protein
MILDAVESVATKLELEARLLGVAGTLSKKSLSRQ